MTKLQRQTQIREKQQRQREKQMTQPMIRIQPPSVPYIPTVDSRQGGYLGMQTLIRDDAQRRYVAF